MSDISKSAPSKASHIAGTVAHVFEKDGGSFNPMATIAEATILERLEVGIADAIQKKVDSSEGVIAEGFKSPRVREALQNKTVPLLSALVIAAGLAEIGDRLKLPPNIVHGTYRVLETLGIGTARGLNAAARKMNQSEWEKHIDHTVRTAEIETPHPAVPASGEKPKFWRFSLDEEVHGPDGCKPSRKMKDAFKVIVALNRDAAGSRNQPRGNQRNAPPDTTAQKPMEFPTESVTVTEIVKGGLRLCPDCFPDGLPKEKPEEHGEESHAKGLKETFGEKVLDVILAANATIAEMGTGKLFAIDEIQEWKDVDPDLMRAMADRLHPRIVDGKLTHDDLEELLTLVPASGVEKLTAINAVGKFWKSAKEHLGHSVKVDTRPFHEAYSPELMDFIRASEAYYEKIPWWKKKKKREFDHFVGIHLLPNPKVLNEFALAKDKDGNFVAWSTELRDTGAFDPKNGDRQFKDWDRQLRALVRSQEIDEERRTLTAKEVVKRGVVSFGKVLAATTVMLLLAYVLGWAFLSTGLGLYAVCISGLLLLPLILLVMPVEWFLNLFDLFLKEGKKNPIDVKGVRLTLSMALGTMTLIAHYAYRAQLNSWEYFPLFVMLLLVSVASTAFLQKAGAYVTLQRSRKWLGIVLSGIVTLTVLNLVYTYALKAHPKDIPAIQHAVECVLVVGLLGGVVFLGWKVMKAIMDKGSEGCHLGVGTILVAGLAGLVTIAIVTKVLLVSGTLVKKFDPIVTTGGEDPAAADPAVPDAAAAASAAALEESRQKAKEAMANAASEPEQTEAPTNVPDATDEGPKAKDSLATLKAKEAKLNEKLGLLTQLKDLESQQGPLVSEGNALEEKLKAEGDDDEKVRLEAQGIQNKNKQDVLAAKIASIKSSLGDTALHGSAKFEQDLKDDLKKTQDRMVELAQKKPSAAPAPKKPATSVAEEGEQETSAKPKLSEKAKEICRRSPPSIRNDPNSGCQGVI